MAEKKDLASRIVRSLTNAHWVDLDDSWKKPKGVWKNHPLFRSKAEKFLNEGTPIGMVPMKIGMAVIDVDCDPEEGKKFVEGHFGDRVCFIRSGKGWHGWVRASAEEIDQVGNGQWHVMESTDPPSFVRGGEFRTSAVIGLRNPSEAWLEFVMSGKESNGKLAEFHEVTCTESRNRVLEKGKTAPQARGAPGIEEKTLEWLKDKMGSEDGWPEGFLDRALVKIAERMLAEPSYAQSVVNMDASQPLPGGVMSYLTFKAAVIVDGRRYPSINAACVRRGGNSTKIGVRLKAGERFEWRFADDEIEEIRLAKGDFNRAAEPPRRTAAQEQWDESRADLDHGEIRSEESGSVTLESGIPKWVGFEAEFGELPFVGVFGRKRDFAMAFSGVTKTGFYILAIPSRRTARRSIKVEWHAMELA